MNIQHSQAVEPPSSVGLMARVDWRRFGLRLAAALAAMWIGFGLVYWGVALVFGQDQANRYTWSADVQFLFAGVNQGEYPNGMAFATSDLVSDVVLERALAELGPEAEGISVSKLAQQLSVTSFFPRAQEVAADYEGRLNAELSQVEIEELEAAYQVERVRGIRGQARLILTASDPDFPATALLEAIPAAWARYVGEELMALSRDRIIYSSRIMSEEVFADTDFVSAYSVLREQLRRLRDNLQVLSAEPNSGLVRDPDSGRRLSDIEAQADQMESLYLDNLLSQVVGLGLTRDPEGTLSFIQARTQELGRQERLLLEQSSRIQQALEDYSQGGLDAVSTDTGLVSSQTGDAFLDRLVSLGVESGDMAFRQALTRERLALDLEATAIRSEMRRLDELEVSVSSMLSRSMPLAGTNGEMTASVEAALDQIIAEIRAMFDATNGIAEQMDVLQFGGSEALYRLDHVSSEPVALAHLWSRGSVYWFWVLSLALALVVVMMVVGHEMLDIIRKRRRLV